MDQNAFILLSITVKLLGKEYNTFGGIKKKNIEKYELDIKQVLSSSVHRSGIASQENIFTMPGSDKIQYGKENTWLYTSSFQSGNKMYRKRKAIQKITYRNTNCHIGTMRVISSEN